MEFEAFYDSLKKKIAQYDSDAPQQIREAQIKPLFYKLSGDTRTDEEMGRIVETFAYGFSTGTIVAMKHIVRQPLRNLESLLPKDK